LLIPDFAYEKNVGIFYLPPMITFGHFEFIFVIKDHKLTWRCAKDKLIKYKKGGLFFIYILGMISRGQVREVVGHSDHKTLGMLLL